MPQVHEFGALVPVCTGKLHLNGRELLYGEHVREAFEWPPYMLKLHIAEGNLTFVNAEQAKQMVAKAEQDQREAAIKILETNQAKLDKVCQDLTARRQEAKALHETITNKLNQAISVAEQARVVLEKAKKEREAIPVAVEIPAAEVATAAEIPPLPNEPKAPPSVIEVEAEPRAITDEKRAANEKRAEKRAEAKARAEAVIISLSRPEVLGITTKFSEMSYRELQKHAKSYDINPHGMSRTNLLDAVVEAAKAKRLAELQAAEDVRLAEEIKNATENLDDPPPADPV